MAAANLKAVAPLATEWHTRPRGTSKAPCPICGLTARTHAEHRATRANEETDALWLTRCRWKRDWKHREVGSRAKQQDAPLKQLRLAAAAVARGATLDEAAQAAGLTDYMLSRLRLKHPQAWSIALSSALAQIDANDWHHTPRGYTICPVCGRHVQGRHRRETDEERARQRAEQRTAKPRERQPRGPGVQVIRGMMAATFAVAAGATLIEAAQAAGVSYDAMRDWERSHPGQWRTLVDNATKQIVEAVRAAAGTDAVFDDPSRFARQAARAERWLAQRDERLFPTSEATLSSFYLDYFLPNCLSGTASDSRERYTGVLKLWRYFTADPPLQQITTAVLSKFRDCLLGMRGRQPHTRKSPNSVRTDLRHLQTVLDKAGPPARRNRDAAGILERVPYVKPPKALLRLPKLVELEQLQAVYLAAVAADVPRIPGIKPPAWWQALLVVALATAFRRRTLFALRMSDVNWRERCIIVDPSQVKNAVGRMMPLNDETFDHLQRIRTDRASLFPWPHDQKHFYEHFHRLQAAAGLPRAEWFGLHAIRRTAATLMWQHSPHVAQLVLGHSSLLVTAKHYVNGTVMLREAVNNLPSLTLVK